MHDYGQFCPIARSSELLAERWTPIIVRNLLNGCRTFNEIRQGAPGISTALLAQRLETLERHGVLLRTVNPSGRGARYELTEMGLALRAVLDAMGQWGAHWLEIEPRHMDPGYVLWATMKLIDVDKIPPGTTVVRFALRDRPAVGYWLILRRPQPELCTRPGGYTEDIVCRTDSRTLIDLHLKRLAYRAALREGRVDLIGPPRLTDQFQSWFRTSPFADFIPVEPVAQADDQLQGVLEAGAVRHGLRRESRPAEEPSSDSSSTEMRPGGPSPAWLPSLSGADTQSA